MRARAVAGFLLASACAVVFTASPAVAAMKPSASATAARKKQSREKTEAAYRQAVEQKKRLATKLRSEKREIIKQEKAGLAQLERLDKDLSKLRSELRQFDDEIAATEAQREALQRQQKLTTAQVASASERLVVFMREWRQADEGDPVAEAAIGCAAGEADRLAAARQSRVEARRGEDSQREYLSQLKRLRQGRAGKALEQMAKRSQRSAFLQRLQQEKKENDRVLKETVQAQGRLEGIVSGFAEQRRRIRRVTPVPSSAHAGQLLWPVRGPVLRGFGRQKHPEFNATIYSSGYEIGAAPGTPVKAAEPGTVVFADWLQGFGRVMIIDHGGEFYTVYGHLEDFSVTVDRAVRRGTVIATLGDTGNLGSPSLYFEVRQGARALNPRNYLGLGE